MTLRAQQYEPPDGHEGFTRETNAFLCAWWVFAIDNDYSDRPSNTSWRSSVRAGPEPDDELIVTVGDIPDSITEGLLDYRATRNFYLNWLLRGEYRDLTTEQRDTFLDNERDEQELGDLYLGGRYSLWLSMELRRPVRIRAHPSAHYHWVHPDSIAAIDVPGFREGSRHYLSAALARIQAAIHPMELRRSLLRTSGYLTAPGRRAFVEPSLSGRGCGRVSTTGWAEFDFTQAKDVVEGLPVGGKSMVRNLREPAEWLWAALSVEDDNLRRFLFSFLGLELLCNTAGRTLAPRVTSLLSNELGGLPIRELAWPSPADSEQHPNRNLVFYFANLAIALSRESADADVAAFKRLARSRHRLAHGAADALDKLPSQDCIALLDRYLRLTAVADADGRLP